MHRLTKLCGVHHCWKDVHKLNLVDAKDLDDDDDDDDEENNDDDDDEEVEEGTAATSMMVT